MKKRKIVLLDSENEREALRLEFADEVHISCIDLVVCEIPLKIAEAFLERQELPSFEEHIFVPRDVAEYIIAIGKN